MNRFWRYVYPCYLWTLPMTLVGFVIANVFYRASRWAWHDGVLTCVAGTYPNGVTRIWGRPSGQTLGWIQMYDTEDSRQETDLRVHETVHVVQAFVCSVLGIVIIPLIFAVLGWSVLWGFVLGGFIGGLGFSLLYAILFVYLYCKQKTGWYDAYRNNPFEVQAYKLQDEYIENPNSKPWGV